MKPNYCRRTRCSVVGWKIDLGQLTLSASLASQEDVAFCMRIFLFGTGSSLRDFLSLLPDDVEVAGLCDNDLQKRGKTVLGYTVLSPEEVAQEAFDYVVVTARTGEVMREQLVKLGVDRERILLFYSTFDKGLREAVNRDMEQLNRHMR